jgi:fumarate reductase subunit D
MNLNNAAFMPQRVRTAIRRNAGWLWRLTDLHTSAKKSTQAIKLPLIFLILGIFFCRGLLANNDSAPVFELTESFMGQPYYVIKIYLDGKVHYRGSKVIAHGELTQSVGVVGDRYGELTQKQLDELIVYFLSLPFELSKKYENKRGNEISGDRISYKEYYMSIYMNDPVFYAVLTKRLDKLINIRQWVCFPKDYPKYPKDHPKYKTCLLRDDVPDTIESFFK